MDQAASGLIGVSLAQREGTYDVSGMCPLQSFRKHREPSEPSNQQGSRRARAFLAISPSRSIERHTPRDQGEGGGDEATDDDASDRGIIRMTRDVDVVYDR